MTHPGLVLHCFNCTHTSHLEICIPLWYSCMQILILNLHNIVILCRSDAHFGILTSEYSRILLEHAGLTEPIHLILVMSLHLGIPNIILHDGCFDFNVGHLSTFLCLCTYLILCLRIIYISYLV